MLVKDFKSEKKKDLSNLNISSTKHKVMRCFVFVQSTRLQFEQPPRLRLAVSR